MDTSTSEQMQLDTSHEINTEVTEAASTIDSAVVSKTSTEGTDAGNDMEEGPPLPETPVNHSKTSSESTDTGNATEEGPPLSESSENNCTSISAVQDSAQTEQDESQPLPGDKIPTQFEGDHAYEVIAGAYYYTDESTQLRYKYDDSSGQWVVVDNVENASDLKSPVSAADQSDSNVHVDAEGRTYYYADDRYLCRYPTGHVYYMNEQNEWVLWDSDAATNEDSQTGDPSCPGGDVNANGGTSQDNSKWYYYKGKDAFYRDHATNTVYKLNKGSNEWEAHKEKGVKRKKKQRPKGTEEEEFDTESSSEEEVEEEDEQGDESESGAAPPGYKNDPNISFDGESYIKKDKDEMLYEWDVNRRAWFPKLDEHFMARYQMSYGFNPDGSKNENPVKYDDDEEDYEEELERERKKKKEEEEKKKKEKKPAGWFEADNLNNTKVYVSHLPADLTEQQFVDLMQKCGLVLKDPETGDYKVKLYKDEQGNFKGDALCTYIKVESVELALQILDGACVGPRSTERITVERAKFQMRGEYNAALKPKKKKKKLLEKIQKNQEKLFSWHLEPLRGQRGKHEHVVIIRNAFQPSEFEDHAERILGHTESLRAQCSSFGTVKKLELFDRHSQGVVKVVFSDVEAADLCITSMNKRLYNKRTLAVGVWDGAEGFKVEETPEERAARIKKWDEFLMKGGEAGGASTGPGADKQTTAATSRQTGGKGSTVGEGTDKQTGKGSEEGRRGEGEATTTATNAAAEEERPLGEEESSTTADERRPGEVESGAAEVERPPPGEIESAMDTKEDSSEGDARGGGDEETDISDDAEDKKLEGSEGGGGEQEDKSAT